jgi:toxin-antitoxin system PIN domain toxin
MQAVDTNLLVYSEIVSSPYHPKARQVLTELCEGDIPWAIPWPCIYEFLRVVTHPRIFHPPVPMSVALEDVAQILASPALLLLCETPRHLNLMRKLLQQSGAAGNLVHDAHIAALCTEHGVREILTGDRDFHRFPDLIVTNPFTE